MKYKINNKIIDAESPVEALKIHKLFNSKCKDNKIIKLEELKEGDKFKDPYGDNKEYIVEKIDNDNYEVKSIKSNIKETFRKNTNVLIDSNCKDEELPKKGDKYSDKRYIYEVKSTYTPFGKLSVIDLIREDGKDFTVGANEFERHFIKINDTECKDDDIDYLSKEEEQAIEDYKKAILNTNDVKLLKLFAHILKEETEHLEELQNEKVEDSCKDSTTTLVFNYIDDAKQFQFLYGGDIYLEDGKWKIDIDTDKYNKIQKK